MAMQRNRSTSNLYSAPEIFAPVKLTIKQLTKPPLQQKIEQLNRPMDPAEYAKEESQEAGSHPKSAFSNLRQDLADLARRMKKFQLSKVTNLDDLIRKQEEEAKAAEESQYVGTRFKIHKGQLAYPKLKQHLKEGTQDPIYEKLLRSRFQSIADSTKPVTEAGYEPNKPYSFQGRPGSAQGSGEEQDLVGEIKAQLIKLQEQAEERQNEIKRSHGVALPTKTVIEANIEQIEERMDAHRDGSETAKLKSSAHS